MTTDAWPPDWRVTRADAAEATVIRLGLVLAELDELEELLSADDVTCSVARQLAGRIRTRRDEYRDEMDALRQAVRETAA